MLIISKKVDKYKFTGKSEFNISKFDTDDCGDFNSREDAVNEFVENLKAINKLQQKLYAERKEGVIFIFQAMDAAGKDGVIRTVFSTLTPHGVKEYCFRIPSVEETNHDFLWRFWSALPARGHISIFNRSYYEDVLAGKVRKLYKNQNLPDRLQDTNIIEQRYDQIKGFEDYLYNSGTRVVKIFLHVSKDEQARRFISRIDQKTKNWKLSANDIAERDHWEEYMEAFETMINNTSTKDSPWYVVPSDHKWYSRLVVSRIILKTLEDIDPQFPEITEDEQDAMQEFRQELFESIEDKEPEEELDEVDSEEDTEDDSVFVKPSKVSADICAEDEENKISVKKKEAKDKGFKAISEMLAKGYILKSTDDIISAVGDPGKLRRNRMDNDGFIDDDF